MEYHPTVKLTQWNFFASSLDRFTGPPKAIEESENSGIRKKPSDMKTFITHAVTKRTDVINLDL
jgi:hypothetical protein